MTVETRFEMEKRLLQSAFRLAKKLEWMGGPSQGARLVRIGMMTNAGRFDEAMRERDAMRDEVVRGAVSWVLLIAIIGCFLAAFLYSWVFGLCGLILLCGINSD